jgi:hypothetical protein
LIQKLNLLTDSEYNIEPSTSKESPTYIKPSTGYSIFTKKTTEVDLIKPALNKLNLGIICYMEIN